MPASTRLRWLATAAFFSAAALVPAVASAETLTADQAVGRAASQNPSLKAALLDVKAAKLSVVAEENARVPTFVAGASGEYSESISDVARSDSESIRANAGVQFQTDIGTSIETGVQTSTVWRNQTGTASNGSGPTYGASAYLTVRQPLLRGGGSDVVLAPLAQAQSAEEQAARQQELEASQTALDVLNAYWELWYAERALDVQERAATVAKRQLADAKAKFEVLGTGTKVDVLQFSSSLASINESLARAKTTRSTAAIGLGRLLGMETEEALLLSTTAEAPEITGAPSNAALRKALVERSKELAALRAQIDSAETRVVTADNANQARVDVYGSASVGGVWSTDDAYSGFDVAGGRPAFTVLAGIEVEIPLGDNRASADAARARVQLDATRERYQARIDALNAQAASLEVELGAADTQVALTTEAADIAEELAKAERTRMELGTTTSLAVVQAEQTLRQAELRMLRAIVDQTTTQFTLEHTAGALLDRYGSSLTQGAS